MGVSYIEQMGGKSEVVHQWEKFKSLLMLDRNQIMNDCNSISPNQTTLKDDHDCKFLLYVCVLVSIIDVIDFTIKYILMILPFVLLPFVVCTFCLVFS